MRLDSTEHNNRYFNTIFRELIDAGVLRAYPCTWHNITITSFHQVSLSLPLPLRVPSEAASNLKQPRGRIYCILVVNATFISAPKVVII